MYVIYVVYSHVQKRDLMLSKASRIYVEFH